MMDVAAVFNEVKELRREMTAFRDDFHAHDREDREERAAIVLELTNLKTRMSTVVSVVGAVLGAIQLWLGLT